MLNLQFPTGQSQWFAEPISGVVAAVADAAAAAGVVVVVVVELIDELQRSQGT